MITESVFDTIQARPNSDFDVKSAPIQFYDNGHNSQSDRWIGPQISNNNPKTKKKIIQI
jgi:hypothetical protein